MFSRTRIVVFTVASILMFVFATACSGNAPAASTSQTSAAPAQTTAAAKPASSAVPGVTDSEITLGTFGSLTGTAAWIGLGARDGVNIVINEVNAAGGINGRKIRMVSADDQGDPAQALAAAKKLVEQDKVFAIFSGAGTITFMGARDYLMQSGVPTVNGISQGGADTPFAPNLFHMYPAAGANGAAYPAFAVDKLKLSKIALMAGTDSTGQTYLDAFVAELARRGMKAVATERFGVDDSDFTAQLMRIRSANPDGVIISGLARAEPLIVRQARDLGIKAELILDSTGTIPSTIEVAGAAAEGIYSGYSLPTYLGDPDPQQQDFERKWKAAYGTIEARPNFVDQYYYGDAYAVKEALQRAGKDLTREKFIAALESLKDFPRPAGHPVTFTDKIHVVNLAVGMNQVKNAKFVSTGWVYQLAPPDYTTKGGPPKPAAK